MAFVRCFSCGRMISDFAETCPFCGAKTQASSLDQPPPPPTLAQPVAPSGQVNLGSILGSSFSIYFSNFLFFTTLSAIFRLPEFMHAIAFPMVDLESVEFDFVALGVNLVLSIFSAGILVTVFMYAVVMAARGEAFSFGSALSNGLRRFGLAFATMVLAGIGQLFGVMLCIVPGLVLACMWYVAVPVATIERAGPLTAMNRSAYLTSDYRGTIFGIIVIIAIINIVLEQMSSAVVAVVGGSPSDILLNSTLAQYAVSVPIVAVQSIAAAHTYALLTMEKDRVGLDELAKVFD